MTSKWMVFKNAVLKNKLVRILLFITIPIWLLPGMFFSVGYIISKYIWNVLNDELDNMRDK
jgi:hypothetical protein